MPTDDIAIPITVTVIVMGIYIVGGAIVFSEWEGWDILSSIYFTWVLLQIPNLFLKKLRVNMNIIKLKSQTKVPKAQ